DRARQVGAPVHEEGAGEREVRRAALVVGRGVLEGQRAALVRELAGAAVEVRQATGLVAVEEEVVGAALRPRLPGGETERDDGDGERVGGAHAVLRAAC